MISPARARCADQEVVRGRQSREQLGAGQRLGARTREDAPPEHGAGAGCISAFHCALRLPRAGPAGDDLAGDRRRPGADRRLAGGKLEHAGGRRARGRRAPGGDQPPDIGRLPEIVGRDMAEQQGVEHALPGIVAHVPREHRVGDLQAGGRGGQSCPEDQPMALVGEIVREREGLFGETGQPVADLAGERGEQGEADGHVGDDRRGQCRVEPVDHPDGRLGHDHRAPDSDEQQHPLGVVLPRPAEGGPEQDPAEPANPGDLGQRHIGAARGDGGHGVQQVDEISAAAEGEELVHGITATRPPRRRARRRARRAGRPREHPRARSRSGAASRPRRARC